MNEPVRTHIDVFIYDSIDKDLFASVGRDGLVVVSMGSAVTLHLTLLAAKRLFAVVNEGIDMVANSDGA